MIIAVSVTLPLKKLILRHSLNEFKRTAAAQFQMQAASEHIGPEDPSNREKRPKTST